MLPEAVRALSRRGHAGAAERSSRCICGADAADALISKEVTHGHEKKAKAEIFARLSSREVKNEMHRYKRGKAKSGKGGRGGKVKSRKQAIAIALNKARKKGKKVPRKKK